MKQTHAPKGIFASCASASSFIVPSLILLSYGLCVPGCAVAQTAETAEALVYSTMPSTNTHSPQMVMDGKQDTYFKSYYNMGDGDDLTIWLSRPVPVTSFRVVTGNTDDEDLLTNGFIELSADGEKYTRSASFNEKGVAEATLANVPVRALRIKLTPRTGISTLAVREITINSPIKITHAQMGPGRGWHDYSGFPDLAGWAQKAEQQMEDFWPDAAAILYSNGFITPNKVNVVYRSGPDVTDVAANGGGVMTVNVKWARAHPEDTGLTVHEMAHSVQSMSAYNPVWLIEGIADYIRWVRYEPQNFTYVIDTAKSWNQPYRTSAAFLAWCEIHYDNRLVTHLNDDIRFGRYNDNLWKKYTGKDADTLWAEFIKEYKADSKNLLVPPVAPADRPRVLPSVNAGSSTAVSLTGLFTGTGFYRDGAQFGANTGFDEGGAAFPAAVLGDSVTWKNVRFDLGKAGQANIVSSRGQQIKLKPGKYGSLWLLAAAVEGNQMAQEFVVNYSDGSQQNFAQNVSDWYSPGSFPGESRAVKFPYRILGDGTKDPRSFYAYSYGFALDKNKEVASLNLPNNPNIKILAVTVAN